LAEVASMVPPETILAWHRKLVAKKCCGSTLRRSPGRLKTNEEMEALIVRMAQENRSWGYDRLAGALAYLSYTISDQTIGTILTCHGIAPAPVRRQTTTWHKFIRTHMEVPLATSFFSPLRSGRGAGW
jgi:putative transposase